MRLLNRSLLSFSIYSVVVLLILTPVFYWVINQIIIRDIDETLYSHRKEMRVRLQKIKPERNLKLWEDLDGDVVIKLEPFKGRHASDSIFSTTSYNSFSRKMEPYRVLVSYTRIDDSPYRLEERISLVESEDLIEALSATQLMVLLTLLSGLVVINWWISKRIWQPFYRTLDELKKFEIDKTPNLQLLPSSIREFEDLNRVITQMTQQDHEAYINQKEFTENAAHEMQTPLAIFQSKLELMLQTDLSQPQAQIMGSLLETTSRLTKLNKALLLLSKIDSRQFVETEMVKVVVLTLRLISFYEEKAKAKAIRIDTKFKNNFSVLFNATLLDILFSNLLSNAIRHSPEQSTVTILVETSKWEIQNGGSPMPIASNRIFDRFQKDPANSASTGLGLAIAKRICDTSGLELTYSFENTHHLFSVDFAGVKTEED